MTNQTGYPYTDTVRDGNNPLSNTEAKETVPQTAYNVYLKQRCNHSWHALISRDTGPEDAAMLCTEKDYPVELVFRRTDVNGSISYDTYICSDRKDLLQTLDWLGTCGFIPCQVWGFDIDKDIDPGLHKLFSEAYDHRLQKIQSAAEDMYADAEEVSHDAELSISDYEMQVMLSGAAERLEAEAKAAFHSLNEQIKLASSRATEANSCTKPTEKHKDNSRFPF